MSELQKQTIKRLRVRVKQLKGYERQALYLMKRNDELLNEIKELKKLQHPRSVETLGVSGDGDKSSISEWA